jgi:hypothetical protein
LRTGEFVVGFSPLPTIKMTQKKEIKFAFDVGIQEHKESLISLLNLMGANSIANAKQKWAAQLASASDLREKIKTRESELTELTNTSTYANAKQRIKALMKKEVTIAERYGLDISFLNEPGKTWSFQVTGKTREEQFKSYTQREQAARAMTRQAYETALQRVVSYCETEKMKATSTRKEVLSVHNRMVNDYNELNQEAFWYEYCGQYSVPTGETVEPVPLVTWLDVCSDYFPAQLITDLRERECEIGVISPELHAAWDTRLISEPRDVAFCVIKQAIETIVWDHTNHTQMKAAILHNVLVNNDERLDEATTLDNIIQLVEG